MPVKERIQQILQAAFPDPTDWILIKPGYKENVHVYVASHLFSGPDCGEREQFVWEILETHLPADELALVSLIVCFTPDQPELRWLKQEFSEDDAFRAWVEGRIQEFRTSVNSTLED
jgi:hypothetical protein